MSDKTTDSSGAQEATAPAARAHNAGDGGAVASGAKRFSAKRKLAAVQRLMRGESLDAVSREENVPVHRLTAWRDKVLKGRRARSRSASATHVMKRSRGCRPRWARSPWITSCCTRRSTSWRAGALWPGGDRRNDADAFDLHSPPFWDVPRLQDLGRAPGDSLPVSCCHR